jgi:hypothetical protein
VEGGCGGGPGAGFQAAVATADRGPRRAGAAERSDAGGPRWVRGFHQPRHLPQPMRVLGGRGDGWGTGRGVGRLGGGRALSMPRKTP